ncbi:MAG: hypothetical protein ACREIM_00070 [Nitrospiraceae bacterium]
MRDRNVAVNSRRDEETPSIGQRIATVGAASMAMFLLSISATPVDANIFGKLGRMYGCVVTWGQVCDLSDTVIGTGPVSQPVPVICVPPLLNGLPQFLSWPKGSAKYRFQGTCSSPAKPGAVMTVRWEGSWTPSETKQDRPNASESLEITGFEPFLPDRAPGGKIFMYWTARCRKDPWLQAPSTGKPGSGQISAAASLQQTNRLLIDDNRTCAPFGAYVPDDLRQALPDIDKHKFPRTGTILSAADRQRLIADYERVNPSYFQQMGIEPRPLSKTFQTIPQSSGIVEKPSAQLNIFSRGTETAEPTQPEGQGEHTSSAPVGASSVASLSEGVDDSPALPPVAITFDQPLHFLSTKGEDILLNPGTYEVEPVLDLQLSLSGEGQEAVLLPAMLGSHGETIQQPVALLIAGESNDERHLVFLTSDGKRFDAVGSLSGVKSRGTGMVALPDRSVKDAMAAVQPASGPSGGCKPNPLPVGPRWLPPGCSPSFPLLPGAAPIVPYVDGSNMLHACLNNHTGVFRIVRPPDACVALHGEIRVKWQLAP